MQIIYKKSINHLMNKDCRIISKFYFNLLFEPFQCKTNQFSFAFWKYDDNDNDDDNHNNFDEDNNHVAFSPGWFF